MSQYVYLHYDIRSMDMSGIFYVGRGSKERALRKGERSRRNSYYTSKCRKIGQENIGVGLIECSSKEESCQLEIGLIKRLKEQGVSLTNLSLGGERGGVGGAFFFGPHSIESRQKMSDYRKGRAAVPRTEEWKRKISQSLKGKVGNTKGMKFGPQTEQHRKKNSDSNKLVPHSTEWNAKISEAKKLRKRAADYYGIHYHKISQEMIAKYKELNK